MVYPTFSFEAWVARFPMLAGRATSDQITALAMEAPTYFDFQAVKDDVQRQVLLNLVVSHLIEINYPTSGTPSAEGLVGRVTNASEGSVSVTLDAGTTTTSKQAWWLQTVYGQTLWASTARFRTFRYIQGYPRRRPLFNSFP